jgi:hypothetical protein
MSVREQVFLRTDRPHAEVARLAAELVGGRSEPRSDHSLLLVHTGRLVTGASGEFGGPVLAHKSERPFRPEGEFEAVDFYTVEIRLWQAHGPRVDRESGRDFEAEAAAAVFDALANGIDVPMIHVRYDDKLARASMPGKGIHDFPEGTTIYDWDEDKWDGFVLLH